jgi:hypothetical protein
MGGRFCIRRDKKLFCWKKPAEKDGATTFSIFPRGFRALGVLSRFCCIQSLFYPKINVLTHFNVIQLNFDTGFEFKIKF